MRLFYAVTLTHQTYDVSYICLVDCSVIAWLHARHRRIPSSVLTVGDHTESTSFLHCCQFHAVLSAVRHRHAGQSRMSSVHLRAGRPRGPSPAIRPSRMCAQRFRARTTWLKYWSLRLRTVGLSVPSQKPGFSVACERDRRNTVYSNLLHEK